MIDQQNVERAAERFRLPEGSFERLALRRDRKRRNQRIRAGVFGIAIAIALGWLGVNAIRSAPVPAVPPEPAVDLGIFATVAGQIVYEGPQGIWGVDPATPADPASRVQLTSEPGIPLGWSSDGTELLIGRIERASTDGAGLFVLHADGSETLVTADPMFIGATIGGATISPDGSRVVFVGGTGELLAVDADGGPAEVLAESREGILEDPTFSPDGTRIAYVDGGGDHSHHVWVMGADGSDAHEIVFNEWTDTAGHVYGLDWSPAGDRIALGLEGTTYTFAPDGSDFTKVIAGEFPYWSPDGSQIAYTISCVEDPNGCGLAIADADGSDVLTFGFATSGPWHPGAPVEEPVAIATPTPLPPPGAGALAYEIDGDIYVADADGSNAVLIADGVPPDGGNDKCANGERYAWYGLSGEAWSPDGRYLAYWDHGCPVPPPAWGTVLITDPEGTPIASFPGQGWANSWSPDSTRVAVWDSWGGPGDATIGVYGLDGVRQATLTVPRELMPSGDQSPVWSRDGSSILLPGLQVPLDGSPPQPFDVTHPGYPVYSPDGSSVAYLDQGSLVVADAGGPSVQEMDPPEIWDAAWSPNGDLVAFAADDTELFVRDVATGADTSLVDMTRSEALTVIEFSPDGDRILFTMWDADFTRSSLWSIGADGSDLHRLADGVRWADLQPQGRPS